MKAGVDPSGAEAVAEEGKAPSCRAGISRSEAQGIPAAL